MILLRNSIGGLVHIFSKLKAPQPIRALEHVELKWVPVQRQKHAQNKGLDREHASIRHEHDLDLDETLANCDRDGMFTGHSFELRSGVCQMHSHGWWADANLLGNTFI